MIILIAIFKVSIMFSLLSLTECGNLLESLTHLLSHLQICSVIVFPCLFFELAVYENNFVIQLQSLR